MAIAGFFASILIGISLGVIGGGGSILTVPVLVYLFNIDAVSATTYSLFVVGFTSAVGSFSYFKRGAVNLRTAVIFGVPSIAAVFFTRTFILPAIPPQIGLIGQFSLTKGVLMMVMFAILMIFAAASMIRKAGPAGPEGGDGRGLHYPAVVTAGLAVGVLTGLVGAGGGFLIIPALVNYLGMPIRTAIGSSLVIIAMNSLLGFLVSMAHHTVQWPLLLSVTLIAVSGILIGSSLSTRIEGRRLKPGFGWFTLAMGVFIIIKETLIK